MKTLAEPGPLSFSTSSLRSTSERSVLFQNAIICFGYVLARVAGGRERLSVLDWGGGVGIHYHLGMALVPGLELDYHVREIAGVCAVGRELEPSVTFHEDDACLERPYDLVMASSSLQYEERWRLRLEQLARAASSHLFLTRVPVVFHAPSYVVRHRASVRGNESEFLSWVINRDELIESAKRAGSILEREFLIAGSRQIPGTPAPQEIRAFLFRAADARQAGTV
jgi:putative methyltransferase (TIGR04325 family)